MSAGANARGPTSPEKCGAAVAGQSYERPGLKQLRLHTWKLCEDDRGVELANATANLNLSTTVRPLIDSIAF